MSASVARGALLAALVASACSTRPPTNPHPPPISAAPPAVSHEAQASETRAEACEGDTFGAAPGAQEAALARIAKKRGSMGRARTQMVASSHPLATQAGLAVLRSGGDAADAFVAATLVQDVVFPGVTDQGTTRIAPYISVGWNSH